MKKFALLAVIGAMLGACEDPIDIIDPSVLDNRNVYIQVNTYWGNQIAKRNKGYLVNGSRVTLDNVYITLTGFEYITGNGDTLRTESDLTVAELLGTKNIKLGYLEPGSYAGTLRYFIGIEDDRALKAPSTYAEDHQLNGGEIWHGATLGHSHFQIDGSVYAETDSTLTGSFDPLMWRFATEDLMIEKTETRNFNVGSGIDVFFVVNLNLENIFVGLYPGVTPEINCDPGNSIDYDAGKIVRDNLNAEFNFEI